MRFRRNSKQEFLAFDFDIRRNSNFDFRTKFRNFGRALFCNLTPIFTENRPKTGRITWFFLASRDLPEKFLLPSVAKIFLQPRSSNIILYTTLSPNLTCPTWPPTPAGSARVGFDSCILRRELQQPNNASHIDIAKSQLGCSTGDFQNTFDFQFCTWAIELIQFEFSRWKSKNTPSADKNWKGMHQHEPLGENNIRKYEHDGTIRYHTCKWYNKFRTQIRWMAYFRRRWFEMLIVLRLSDKNNHTYRTWMLQNESNY